MRKFTNPLAGRRVTIGVSVAVILGVLLTAALGGRHELGLCEAALHAELGEAAPYFRIGYRMRQEWDGKRVFYLVFFAQRHGLATCHFALRGRRYALTSFSMEMTLRGGPPAAVP